MPTFRKPEPLETSKLSLVRQRIANLFVSTHVDAEDVTSVSGAVELFRCLGHKVTSYLHRTDDVGWSLLKIKYEDQGRPCKAQSV